MGDMRRTHADHRNAGTGTFDHVVVGGGSAGSALAHRLSADPRHRVLVLEAGRPDRRWDPLIAMPAALGFPVGRARYDWCYRTEAEPLMNGRRMRQPRGRILGGSSSINGMMYQRGHPADYDRWAAETGDPSWDYAHCLPYYRRLEQCLADDPGAVRGHNGPQVLERGPARGPLFDAFFAAAREAGYDVRDDVNDHVQEGFASLDRTIHRGRRLSAARAYLHPVRSRPNLVVRCRALVTRIVFTGRRAVGVRYRDPSGAEHEVRGGEIILAAGAIATPQLLQLSGVGRAQELRSLGVDVVVDLPAVGEHLQDHLAVHLQHACRLPVSLTPMRERRNWPGMAVQWLVRGTGPGATNHFEAGGFVRSDPALEQPDLMLAFAPLAMRSEGAARIDGHGYQLHLSVMRSDARGTVKIRSRDVAVHPVIQVNYLSGPGDRRTWVRALALARGLLGQPAFTEFDAGEVLPGPAFHTEEQILNWVASTAQTGLHPACTARMGTGPDSVVGPADLRVHGIAGLRVIDASAMPSLGNANTYAPTMMLAEKAGDLVLGNTPLPPEPVPAPPPSRPLRHGSGLAGDQPDR